MAVLALYLYGSEIRTKLAAIPPATGLSSLEDHALLHLSGDVERISTGKAARICGVSRKTLLRLAREGKIPGAVELDNGLWRFHEGKLRDWLRGLEAQCQRRATTSISGTAPGTLACKSVGATYDVAYEQLLGQRR